MLSCSFLFRRVIFCFVPLFLLLSRSFSLCPVLSVFVSFFLVFVKLFLVLPHVVSRFVSVCFRSILFTPVVSYPFSLCPAFSLFVALCPAVFPSLSFRFFFHSILSMLVLSRSYLVLFRYFGFCLSRYFLFIVLLCRSFACCPILSRLVSLFLVL